MHLRTSSILQLAAAAALLFVGGMIYVLFRSTGITLFGWLDALGLSGAVEAMRDMAAGVTLPRFILYSLPDGLWLASYLLIVNVIVSRDDRWTWLFFTLLMPAWAIANEVLQGMGITRGSYDPYDLVCYAVPLIADLIINWRRLPKPTR